VVVAENMAKVNLNLQLVLPADVTSQLYVFIAGTLIQKKS
jgi:hypothetical protein